MSGLTPTPENPRRLSRVLLCSLSSVLFIQRESVISVRTFTPYLCLLLLVVLFTAGCDDGKLQLGKVSGDVTIDGEPLLAGQIIFVTDSRRAFGTIENGKIIDVTTYQTGDGVTLGNHRVAVRPKVDEAEMMKPPKDRKPDPLAKLVPARYHDADTSGLTVEIKKGSNELKIELSK